MTQPIQTPYNKVNIVDEQGNLITSFGGAGNQDLASATNQIAQNTKLEEIKTELQQIKDNGTPINGAVLPIGGSKLIGWLSAIWKLLVDRNPILINGRVPVDVASLSVTVSNSQVEISNDAGSPIPVSGNISIGNLPATQQIAGTVAISNQVEIANDVGNPLAVTGQIESRTSAKYWREDFSGNALPNDWTLIQTGAGQSISISNSELQIVSGTTPNTETIIERILNLRNDTRVTVGFLFRISSRVPNQEIIFELNDGAGNSAQWIFSGTGGGSASINTSNNGFSIGSSIIGNLIDSFNYSIAQIELKDASIEFSNLVINNTQFTRQSAAVRSRQIPGADSLPNLRLRIRVRNLTPAPGSTTTFIDAVYLSETQKVLSDIVGGFGGNSMHSAIPCNVLSMPSPVTYPVNTTFYHTESIFPLAANGSFIGSSRDNRNLSRIVIFCLTDQPGTLFLEASPDNSSWFVLNPISISANTPFDLSKHIPMRFYRLRYVNGATAQASLRIYSSQINI